MHAPLRYAPVFPHLALLCTLSTLVAPCMLVDGTFLEKPVAVRGRRSSARGGARATGVVHFVGYGSAGATAGRGQQGTGAFDCLFPKNSSPSFQVCRSVALGVKSDKQVGFE